MDSWSGDLQTPPLWLTLMLCGHYCRAIRKECSDLGISLYPSSLGKYTSICQPWWSRAQEICGEASRKGYIYEKALLAANHHTNVRFLFNKITTYVHFLLFALYIFIKYSFLREWNNYWILGIFFNMIHLKNMLCSSVLNLCVYKSLRSIF